MKAPRKMQLCVAAMSGDMRALAELGNPQTLGELDAIMRDAFDAMTPEERAQDLAETEWDLDSIVSVRR